MKRFYFIHDNKRHPIIGVGVFQEGTKKVRTITIYGKGEPMAFSRKFARDLVETRFNDSAKILAREKFVNEIPQGKLWKRIKDQPETVDIFKKDEETGKAVFVEKRDVFEVKRRNVKELILDQDQLLKIDLNPVFTEFEQSLLKKKLK